MQIQDGIYIKTKLVYHEKLPNCFIEKYSSTFSRELVLSLLLSSRLFPESVDTREPLESAWWTELTLGVELWGEAAVTGHKSNFQRMFYSFWRLKRNSSCISSDYARITGITVEWGFTCSRDNPKHIFMQGIFYAAPRFLRSHHGVGHQGVLPGILGQKATKWAGHNKIRLLGEERTVTLPRNRDMLSWH